MPRQLPWLNKGGGSRTQVKAPPRTAPRSRIQSDIDDDFFEGTVLASSGKGKRRVEPQESDDDFPELPKKHVQTPRKGKGAVGRSRMPSSSPPPAAALLPPPETEYMHKGIDKFDLRDDEWMMVEDELLQTAKLFTQHLHLEEYERLKKRIDEQKKEPTARPVATNAKPSVEGHFKDRAKEQEKAQQKAVKEIFSSAKADNDTEADAPIRIYSNKATSSHISSRTGLARSSRDHQRTARLLSTSASDSEDLDGPIRPTRPTATNKPPKPDISSNTPSNSFVKPTTPASTRPRPRPSRPNRQNPFDMWDDMNRSSSPPPIGSKSGSTYRIPSPTKSSTFSTTKRSSSPTKPSRESTIRTSPVLKKSARALDLDDFDIPKREPISKRKANSEKADKKKPKFDDTIPTFLF